MEKVTKILVPIDFSNYSENALSFAMHLADKVDGNIQVLNVLSWDGRGGTGNPVLAKSLVDELIESARNQIKNSIEKVTEQVRSTVDKIPPIEFNITAGSVVSTIADVAQRNDIDYIVMGTQGENSAFDKFLGSIASNVLKDAPCPVFVIPEEAAYTEQIIMGYATEFSDADPLKIWTSMKLLDDFRPEIKCVHFNDQQINYTDKITALESFFKLTNPSLKISFFNLPVKDRVTDMNNFIKAQNINVLVMYKPERGFFESLFHKSFTREMAMHIKIPLLVLKNKNL